MCFNYADICDVFAYINPETGYTVTVVRDRDIKKNCKDKAFSPLQNFHLHRYTL